MKEIETKLIGFDEKEVLSILEERAAKLSDRIQRRWVFDLSDGKSGIDEVSQFCLYFFHNYTFPSSR